jgi:hypothetical protein
MERNAMTATNNKPEDVDTEPFDSRERTVKEMDDHNNGFEGGLAGESCDETKSLAWQRGWADAQE